MNMADQSDLFGYAPPQGSLFGEGENRMPSPVISTTPDPAAIRVRLQGIVAQARAAQKMPWPEREARMWQIVFPNMANWLPDEEAKQLRLEFWHEIERLKAPPPTP